MRKLEYLRNVAVFLVVTWCLAADPSWADSRILDAVDVSKVGRETAIVINFNQPARYVSHAPKSRGNVVQIQLRLIGSNVASNARERLSRKPSDAAPLSDVTLENDAPQGPLLTLRFSRKIQFRIKSGADFRSISVFVPATPTPKKTEQRAPVRPKKSTRTVRAAASRSGRRVNLSYPYAINLMSSVTPIPRSVLPSNEQTGGYRLYTTRITTGGKTWTRLRLGFFESKAAADAFLEKSLRGAYSTAWVAKASKEERRLSAKTAIAAAVPAAAPQKPPKSSRTAAPRRKATLAPMSRDRMAIIADEARKAMTAREYRRAIQLYTMLLQLPENEFQEEAQELLGLARERNGQTSHAIAEYEEYLRRYPKGEGAARVQQRLAGLETARAKPRKRREDGRKVPGKKGWSTEVYGSLSQYFDRDESFTDSQGKIVNQSAVRSDIDVTMRARSDAVDIRNRFSGGMRDDVFANRSAEHQGTISTLYLDVVGRNVGLSTRLGRQTRSSGGVLGRFDGGLVSYRALPELGINVVGGFPVDKTVDFPADTDRYFYGVSTDLGPFADHWSGNLFFIDQTIEGIDDRRAVGGEARYVTAKRSAFSLVDYDIDYGALNTLLFTGNWTFPTRTTATLSLDYRKSPVLTTRNALQGQPVLSIWQMLDKFTEDQIRDLAEDRTAASKSVTVGVSHPITDKYQVNGEFRASGVSGTPSSGGVSGTPSTGAEFFGSLQFIASGFFMSGDANIIGLSYNDASNADTLTGTLNSRFPVTRDFRLNPKIRADFRHNKSTDSDRIRVVPAIRMNYRLRRNVALELQGGGEWVNDQLPTGTENNFGYFVSFGYRWDFGF